jgi:hypothetical protein
MDGLILDDWGLAPLGVQERQDLLEVLDHRCGQRSPLSRHSAAAGGGRQCGGRRRVRVAADPQVLQVEKRDRPAACELRQRPVPALDRLVLDEERRQRLLQELVRLGLRLGLHQRRLRVALGLRHFRIGERLLALQLNSRIS